MSKEKKLLIAVLILTAIFFIFTLGLSRFSDDIAAIGMFCGIAAMFGFIIYMTWREGKQPNWIFLGLGMAIFGIIFLGAAQHFSLATIPLSIFFIVIGIGMIVEGIKYCIKHPKPLNKKIYTGIGLLVGTYPATYILFCIYPPLIMLAVAMFFAGIIVISQGIDQRNKHAAAKAICCARCKKTITEQQTVWIGNHRFCPQCAKPGTVAPANVTSAATQAQPSNDAHLCQICAVCRRLFNPEKMVFIDGEYYCQDCYSFTFNKGRKEESMVPEGLCQISYEISNVGKHTLYFRITTLADRLMDGGFRFHVASVGHHAYDPHHSGITDHSASYTDYREFQNNEDRKISNQSASTSDPAYICAFLSRHTLKVHLLAEGSHIVLRWIDTSEKSFPATKIFAENVIKEAYHRSCKLTRIDNIELQSSFFEPLDLTVPIPP